MAVVKVTNGLLDFGIGTSILKQQVIGEGSNGVGLQVLDLDWVWNGPILGKFFSNNGFQRHRFVARSRSDVSNQSQTIAVELPWENSEESMGESIECSIGS
jgi:hypothetical protein